MNCRNTVLAPSLVFTAALIFGVDSKIPSSLRCGIKENHTKITVAFPYGLLHEAPFYTEK